MSQSFIHLICMSDGFQTSWSPSPPTSFPIIENIETSSLPTYAIRVHRVVPAWLHILPGREGKHGNWMIWIHPRSVGGKEYQDGWSHIARDHTEPSMIKMFTKYGHWAWDPTYWYL